jgi:hypothetical protein
VRSASQTSRVTRVTDICVIRGDLRFLACGIGIARRANERGTPD